MIDRADFRKVASITLVSILGLACAPAANKSERPLTTDPINYRITKINDETLSLTDTQVIIDYPTSLSSPFGRNVAFAIEDLRRRGCEMFDPKQATASSMTVQVTNLSTCGRGADIK